MSVDIAHARAAIPAQPTPRAKLAAVINFVHLTPPKRAETAAQRRREIQRVYVKIVNFAPARMPPPASPTARPKSATAINFVNFIPSPSARMVSDMSCEIQRVHANIVNLARIQPAPPATPTSRWQPRQAQQCCAELK